MQERNYSRKWSEQEDALLLVAINSLELDGTPPNFQQLAKDLSKKFGRRYTSKSVYEHFLRFFYQRFLETSSVIEEDSPTQDIGKSLRTVVYLCEMENRLGGSARIDVQNHIMKRPPKEKIRDLKVRASDVQFLNRIASLANCPVHLVISWVVDVALKNASLEHKKQTCYRASRGKI